MKNSLVKNYVYNTLYQILVIFLPIITTPYVSRVLGANNIGIYSYTLSITTYFILFGSLGISLYGQREIAYLQGNPEKYSKVFWEIIFLRIITMSVSLLTFYFSFILNSNEYSFYYTILIFEIIASIFDISWFFQGLEEFKKTIVRNIFVKFLSVIFIFLFVKQPEHLIYYFLIYVLSNLFGNLSLWLYLPKYLKKINIKKINIFRHLKPIILLFIPQIAIQIYTVLDKVMIGSIILDKTEVGFYEQSQKVIKILLSIVSSLGTVMLPRIANSFAKNDDERINNYMYKSLNATLIISIPMIFGIFAVADNFVPLFFGEGYNNVIILMQVIAPIILMIGLSGNIGSQYLLTTKQQGKFTLSVIIGAIVNFIINILLIPKYGALGASIGTVIAESIVTISQIIMTYNQIDYKNIFNSFVKYSCFSFLMYASCYLVNYFNMNDIFSLLLKFLVGISIYFIMLFIKKDKFTFDVLKRFRILK